MTEKPIHDHAIPRPPPTTDRFTDVKTSRGLRAPCQYRQGASLLVQAEPASARSWPSSDDLDIREAARNFEAYLNILREWDEKEKRTAGRSEAD